MCIVLKKSQLNIHFDKLISDIPKEKYISLNFHALFCTVCSRISKIMSCEESAVFFQKMACIPERKEQFGSWKNLHYAKRKLVKTDSYVLYVSTTMEAVSTCQPKITQNI